jgi:surface carbohydrate biosynthesis protein
LARTSVDVLILVHHPQRELDIAALLKVLLEDQHGLKCAIASYRYNDYQTLAKWNPRVVALPWFYSEEKGFVRYRSYWPQAKFIDMAYEQIYQKINEGLKVIEGPYARTEMRFAAWGSFYQDFLSSHGIPRDRVDVCGNPSYGLYRDPYRSYFVSREELADRHGLNPAKRWIFFPENYRAAFMSREQLDRFERTMNVPGISNRFRDFAEASLEEVCRWLHSTPLDSQVILRPRPAVGMEPFVAKVGPWLKGLEDRLFITTEATVREWILASDVVVSSYSTSLIEASLADKKIAILEPVPFPDFVMNEWYDHVDRVKTADQMESLLSGTWSGGSPDSLRSWAVEKTMSLGDPLARTAEWMASITQTQLNSPGLTSGEDARLGLKARLRQLGDELKWKVRGQREKIPMKDWFTDDDADARVAKWRTILSRP